MDVLQKGKTMSLVGTLLLIIVLPLIGMGYCLIEDESAIRIYSSLFYFAMSIAVAMWFMGLGVRIGKRDGVKNKIGLIPVAVAGYLICIGALFVGRFDFCMSLRDFLGLYFAEMFVYRVPQLLYGMVFLVLGIFISGKEYKLSGRKGWVYCCISAVLYLACVVGAELVYNGHDEYHVWHALIHAVSVFPLMGLVMSIYNLSGGDYKIGKCKGFADFLAYLYPSAIFIYVLKIYASPILVLLYLVVMWFIYRKFR